jgi:hypothetical protein
MKTLDRHDRQKKGPVKPVNDPPLPSVSPNVPLRNRESIFDVGRAVVRNWAVSFGFVRFLSVFGRAALLLTIAQCFFVPKPFVQWWLSKKDN